MFIKLLDWHPMIIAGSRSAIAALFLLTLKLILPAKGGKNPPFPLWAGALSYALTMISFVFANTLTTAANAIMLQYSAPLWAALLGWYFNRERPRWEHWSSMALVALGLFIFFQDGLATGALLGDSVALSSGLVFGATSVFMRMLKGGDPRDAMLLSHLLCALASIPFYFIQPPNLTASQVLPVLYMGLFQLGLASAVYSYGIQRISAVQAMLTAMIEPILNPLWVLAITGERPSLRALGGGVIILLAVLFSSIVGVHRAGEKK